VDLSVQRVILTIALTLLCPHLHESRALGSLQGCLVHKKQLCKEGGFSLDFKKGRAGVAPVKQGQPLFHPDPESGGAVVYSHPP